MIDVAIVGGGVSGCYCAYRLAQAPRHARATMRLYERSGRIGGRLWSQPLGSVEGSPAELGGMFFSDEQKNVFELIQKLGLRTQEVEFGHGRDFLRRRFIADGDYADAPDSIPYDLDEDEKRALPQALLGARIMGQFPELRRLWPFRPGADPRQTAEYLRAFPWRGRPLHDWGFWNFLSEIVSNEAYELLLSTVGCSSTLRNSNAYDAVWTLLFEWRRQTFYRLVDGYDQLPKRLVEDAGARVETCLGHELERVDLDGDGLRLHFEGRASVKTGKLILALPRRALERVEFGEGVFDEAFRDGDLRSVIQVPACKLFLAFKSPWWRKQELDASAAGKAVVSASYTDLPVRQCYYYGNPKDGETALVLATYADDVAASFWKGLRAPNYCNDRFAKLGADQDDLLCAPRAMVDAARRQLQAMHPPPVVVGAPVGAVFFDWSDDPYGAAWHAWKAYLKSWQVARRMRRPNPKLPVFICGEAYASPQGWVEGAVNTAELVMREGFDLDRADWIPPGYEMELGEDR